MLVSVFSAASSSCAVRDEEEADGVVVFQFAVRLHKVIVVLLDLVDFVHFCFCIMFC